MKKITMLFLGCIAMLASHGVMAQTEIVTGVEIVPANDCTLLDERVTLNLSNNVVGAYDCNLTEIEIRVATCHAGGSRTTNTYDCAGTNDPAGSGCADANDTYEIVDDFSAFTASSRGGRVAPEALGGTCTLANVQGLGFFD